MIMIRDQRHTCNYWLSDNVGAVIFPSYANLYHSNVHLFSEEDIEGQNCEKLEIRRPVLLFFALANFIVN